MNNNVSSGVHPSTTSLQSTNTVSSTTPLLSSQKQKQKRKQKDQSNSPKTASPAAPAPSSQPHSNPQPKDYEQAFANLTSSYGYMGGTPSLPKRRS
ncbi:hypothetical protein SERLA73DRAFT_192089 [Serpula lacrymans var. lacrymans S7.3]|uniref:Uncharacterized protein n=2 Tax=Serpula lacrymans var. lacrymans TaxID=341189 RepID=F8QIY9_SERL3|nr:uncharacterized protein SERLADRAFT_459738 [Serpula lacrymans var. lacrymans S7.9]EGN91734.1 hypothetical protein SERLA73DRAFT_192089 [Serpula lacrymans var. lacrymans S7.3]EGO28873.1 hypothetical protein SERLADRAFT_459738 [Serpula lacrymans var. lacrymans S7.9]